MMRKLHVPPLPLSVQDVWPITSIVELADRVFAGIFIGKDVTVLFANTVDAVVEARV